MFYWIKFNINITSSFFVIIYLETVSAYFQKNVHMCLSKIQDQEEKQHMKIKNEIYCSKFFYYFLLVLGGS